MSDTTSNRSTPALFEHCQTVYDMMKEKAREDGVYEGFLTKEFSGLHLSVPYYTSVMRALRGMGCIEQLRRGGGSAPSRWQVGHEPTEELFRAWQDDVKDKKQRERPSAQSQDQMLQMIRDMNKRLARLEEAVFNQEISSG